MNRKTSKCEICRQSIQKGKRFLAHVVNCNARHKRQKNKMTFTPILYGISGRKNARKSD